MLYFINKFKLKKFYSAYFISYERLEIEGPNGDGEDDEKDEKRAICC